MISEILQTIGRYTSEEEKLFKRAVTVRQVAKNDFLLRKGEVSKSIYFLLSGAAFQFEKVLEMDVKIIDLHVEKEWFTNYHSLISQTPADTDLRAFTDCEILEMPLDAVHYLVSQSAAFLQLNKVLEGSAAKMKLFDQAITPAEKYEYILRHRPQLIQKFPLKMISSYLKVTPETLSRVRKSMSVLNKTTPVEK